ncbi:hypothetical protein RHMOL_Rhmol06G0137700 [Rhododendron molle]|uniref:Uncharacterized protein n=1 Tax=Rhododendron molle TaxID=49168 RepID=A0ACC0NC62_RHOML|nr:hypothetical protein RHMOL_Rhmol06G0137700 [Rhododendron molle]
MTPATMAVGSGGGDGGLVGDDQVEEGSGAMESRGEDKAKLEAEATGEPQGEEEVGGEAVPRRSGMDKAMAAFAGQGAHSEATYVPFQHVVVPYLLDTYRPERPTYDEALVLRDPQQHLSLRRADVP